MGTEGLDDETVYKTLLRGTYDSDGRATCKSIFETLITFVASEKFPPDLERWTFHDIANRQERELVTLDAEARESAKFMIGLLREWADSTDRPAMLTRLNGGTTNVTDAEIDAATNHQGESQ